MFQCVWRNIYCFDFIFITHDTGILGNKVTLRSHIRYTHLKNVFPLAVLHFKRWKGACGFLNMVWLDLWIFEYVSSVADAFRTPCSNNCFDVWLYEFDPLKQSVLHSIFFCLGEFASCYLAVFWFTFEHFSFHSRASVLKGLNLSKPWH